uniref:Uncharacterized protein n=1 Tax=Tanacetum cinerariifolium TaxID=118510 RepID=A0A6L2KC03_TANCI|nr:hypothetical protein [Tanacetum cinerariifolium]
MINGLSSMEAANVLSSGGEAASVSLADVLPAAGVPTVSEIFTTANVVTPYTRRSRGILIIGEKDKGKEKVIETKVPKKRKLQEQIDAQVAREMEEEFSRENQRLSEKLVRDSEIARLHVEEELKIMIEGLDRSNEVIEKHLSEYEQPEADLSVGEKIELISELFEDFVPMSSKEEIERVKRQGLKRDQGSSKRMKVSEGVSEEELKGMMQLVPFKEVKIKALHVKHPIIDSEIHFEGKREYWKILRLGVTINLQAKVVDPSHGNNTFYNILFDADYDFSSSDDQSFYDEDILKEIYSNPLFDEEIISMKIDPHHFNAESHLIESLFNHDSPVISSSSKIDSLFDEFTDKLTLLKSIPPGINETDCNPEEESHLIKRLLYDNSSPRPLKEFVFENSDVTIESFSSFPIPVEDCDTFMEEIDFSFTPDDPMSLSI